MKFSTDIPALHGVRRIGIKLSSSQVAQLLRRSPSWPNKNTHLFITEREGKLIKFELSSVLEYYFKNQ